MTNRLEVLREKVDELVNRIELNGAGQNKRRYFFVHLYGVSHFGALLALKRGLDAELASACGMLHDIYAVLTGSYEDHGPRGSEEARKILRSTGLFTVDEIKIIAGAIFYHGEKDKVHQVYDEVLKDADVLHHCLYNPGFPIQEVEKERYGRILAELGC